MKDPYDLDQILKLSDHLRYLAQPKDLELLAAELVKHKSAVWAIEARYHVKFPTLKELSSYPKDSFGWAFYQHLTSNQITLESLKGPEVIDDVTYIAAHLAETHDLWHTLHWVWRECGRRNGCRSIWGSAVSIAVQFHIDGRWAHEFRHLRFCRPKSPNECHIPRLANGPVSKVSIWNSMGPLLEEASYRSSRSV